MTDKMMHPSDWPDRMQPLDPVKQLFDRVFEQRAPRDAPAAVGQQWIPAVDIKEEAHRFILYVDAPGVATGTVEVRRNRACSSSRGSVRPNPRKIVKRFCASNAGPERFTGASPCLTAPIHSASRLQRATASCISLSASVWIKPTVTSRSGQRRMNRLVRSARSTHRGGWRSAASDKASPSSPPQQ